MPNIEGATIAVIGGAGFIGSHIVDQLLEEPVERVSCSTTSSAERARTSRVRRATRASRCVEGSILDLPFLEAVMTQSDYVFHLAALWLHECVHDPRDADRRQRRRHVQRDRGGPRGERRQGRLLVVRLGLRRRSRHPDDRGTPVQQPDALRRDEDRGRAVLPRLQRAARARLRRPALHERLRAADGLQGHVRQRDHEGARQDRGGRAAGDLRRRLAGVRLRARRRRRARERPRAEDATRPTSSSTSGWACRRRSTSSSTRLLEITGADLEPEYRPAGADVRHASGRQHRAGRAS